MTAREHLLKIVDTVENAINDFNAGIPSIQNSIIDDLEIALRELELLPNGRIKPSVKNLKSIARIKSKIENIILSNNYENDVSSFTKAFDDITTLQRNYFEQIEQSFKPSALMREMQLQSVDATRDYLLRAGIDANIVNPIQNIMRQNVTDGVLFGDMMKQLRVFIAGDAENVGHLSRYVKTYTTDALNQFSSNYMALAASDLGLKWFRYVGVKMNTSREFCVAMVNKRFYHEIELPDLIAGNFTEFRDANGSIYSKTGLPDGMVAGTNPDNFQTYRGGWNCQHLPIPVTEQSVPKNKRISVYTQYGITFDENGFATSA